MKQIIQPYKTGEMKLGDAPVPQVMLGMVLVETRASLISAGTESPFAQPSNSSGSYFSRN